MKGFLLTDTGGNLDGCMVPEGSDCNLRSQLTAHGPLKPMEIEVSRRERTEEQGL